MNNPIPVLYVPTPESRKAALATFSKAGIYLNEQVGNNDLTQWETHWGKTHKIQYMAFDMILLLGHNENVKILLSEGRGTLVNSATHMISYLRSKGAIK